jgi:hypothetical protein
VRATRAVYGSKYLALYIRGPELDKLLDGLALGLDLYAETTLLGEAQVIVALMPDGLKALQTVVRAERSAYGKGRTRWKRFPPDPLK